MYWAEFNNARVLRFRTSSFVVVCIYRNAGINVLANARRAQGSYTSCMSRNTADVTPDGPSDSLPESSSS